MPELPEVETVRRGLLPAMEGARFTKVETRRPNLRWPFPERMAERMAGTRVQALTRRAKYMIAELSSGESLIMHLGMSGSFRIEDAKGKNTPGEFHHPRSKLAAHDHVVFTMESGTEIVFNDPRRFGFMLLMPDAELRAHPLLAGLGPEPLGNAFDAAMLATACRGKRTSLKAALMDQTVVAGLGNIYVCEALHLSHLSPKRGAATLANRNGTPHPRAVALVDAIKIVLGRAIRAGGSSLRDHRQTNGDLGYFQHDFSVYDREGEPCRTTGCGGTIKRIVQQGRSTFYCPKCQK
ncbi:formamidopyrimidine-DNA glycosylase [Variibacter gotjawalensis]|uniref:Formamidopyrimidine-DNA glycosylase n=1 Tax=Variibacter gotjawalensis TaxID=1333996 RepID=A0A0S3Q0N7_9BRAD|nr:bifunctional DNA-formamidopyrimidine glycosylase/DNA-(apurinic or apyrimidinic site) lyase [Variibacter gotjawalensis]NIK47576.1 formamidopyrimidine-DNA glycosylase [Variibacter gotjawalensis]RZS49473.1 DNA-(apurinic or apyrimidinic site) lyase [Variibacter gotjawalensis]BAT61736.1 formamidopyrimidine-DNA glycosylase [Variibacter gotjawalensis]